MEVNAFLYLDDKKYFFFSSYKNESKTRLQKPFLRNNYFTFFLVHYSFNGIVVVA